METFHVNVNQAKMSIPGVTKKNDDTVEKGKRDAPKKDNKKIGEVPSGFLSTANSYVVSYADGCMDTKKPETKKLEPKKLETKKDDGKNGYIIDCIGENNTRQFPLNVLFSMYIGLALEAICLIPVFVNHGNHLIWYIWACNMPLTIVAYIHSIHDEYVHSNCCSRSFCSFCTFCMCIENYIE
jgi:hypothetical protein